MALAVGADTNSYEIEKSLIMCDGDTKTPLQEKLEKVANQIGTIGFFAAVLTLIILTIRYCFELSKEEDATFFSVETLNQFIANFIFAISVIVAAVPEGLPLAVTISLAYTVNKMYEEKNFVKQL